MVKPGLSSGCHALWSPLQCPDDWEASLPGPMHSSVPPARTLAVSSGPGPALKIWLTTQKHDTLWLVVAGGASTVGLLGRFQLVPDNGIPPFVFLWRHLVLFAFVVLCGVFWFAPPWLSSVFRGREVAWCFLRPSRSQWSSEQSSLEYRGPSMPQRRLGMSWREAAA